MCRSTHSDSNYFIIINFISIVFIESFIPVYPFKIHFANFVQSIDFYFKLINWLMFFKQFCIHNFILLYLNMDS